MKKIALLASFLFIAPFFLSGCMHKDELTPSTPQTQNGAESASDDTSVESLESELDSMSLEEETFQ